MYIRTYIYIYIYICTYIHICKYVSVPVAFAFVWYFIKLSDSIYKEYLSYEFVNTFNPILVSLFSGYRLNSLSKRKSCLNG